MSKGTNRQEESKKRRVKELVADAMDRAPLRDDGGVDEKVVLDILATEVPFDEISARRDVAKKILKDVQKPGRTTPDGQLALPGFDAFAWEPDRVISDSKGHLVKQVEARPEYKSAEADRARKNARQVNAWNDRKQAENNAFAQWGFEQIARFQRPVNEITFGNFIREVGWWSDGAAVPEPGPFEEE